MLFALFAAMPDTSDPVLTPQVSTIAAASLSSGACSPGHTAPQFPAQVRVSWTLQNMDTSLYDTKLYENGVLVATTSGVLQWDKTITGAVEFGNRNPWVANWTYRLDVVRKTDAQVVASKTSAQFHMEYGGCSDLS